MYNPNNELYYMFYSVRVKDELSEKYFGVPNFEEGCKIGVATSKSPEGPFRNITNEPIDYRPHDHNYLNVDTISENPNHPTMSFQEAFEKAERGTFVPLIDIDIFFDNEHLYFYFSRCCYKNFVYDSQFGKFVEESHILCAEFDSGFWYDKEGKQMPQVMPNFRNYDKDSYYELIAYWREPQAWENGHINDFEKYHPGRKFTLIERSGKKALFLADTAVMMHASNVEVRAEDADLVKEQFDLVLFRALGQFTQYFPTLYRLASPGGHLFAYKGRKEELEREIQSLSSDIQKKTIIKTAHVPFLEDERNFVIIER